MNVGFLPQPPHTETSAYVRPIVKVSKRERAAVWSDAPMRLAEDFLESLRGEYQPEVVAQSQSVLRELRRQLRELPIPTIAPAPDGVIGMTWEGERYHVNVQIHPDRRLEFFAEDLTSGTLWSDEAHWGSNLEALVEHLRRVD